MATLNRFRYFLQFPVEACDYIFFMNSNTRCYEQIMFTLTTDYIFTQHYWFVNKPYSVLTLEKDAASKERNKLMWGADFMVRDPGVSSKCAGC